MITKAQLGCGTDVRNEAVAPVGVSRGEQGKRLEHVLQIPNSHRCSSELLARQNMCSRRSRCTPALTMS